MVDCLIDWSVNVNIEHPASHGACISSHLFPQSHTPVRPIIRVMRIPCRNFHGGFRWYVWFRRGRWQKFRRRMNFHGQPVHRRVISRRQRRIAQIICRHNRARRWRWCFGYSIGVQHRFRKLAILRQTRCDRQRKTPFFHKFRLLAHLPATQSVLQAILNTRVHNQAIRSGGPL